MKLLTIAASFRLQRSDRSMDNRSDIWRGVDAIKARFIDLSDKVWGTPEVCYTEARSAAEHLAELKHQGFRITENVAGIPTALMGEWGEGGPVIAFLGEYDALPGLSQEAGVAEHRPVETGGHGHGCGHNLLGSAALLAATAVKDWLAEHKVQGRVRYYGCPAEEGGAAKAFMVRSGAFADADIAVTWHPHSFWEVAVTPSLANTRADFIFTGRTSHAAASPHLGRSALDAVELMNVGVNYMREHMPSDARVHYALLDTGGIAPNVVQAHARVRYSIRARDLPGMTELVERASTEMRRGRGMRGAAGEDEIGARVRERRRDRDFPEAVRVPGHGDIGIGERARAHHEGLGRAAFLGGTAVIADAAGHLVLGKPVLHGGGGEQRRRAQQIVAAAMAVTAGLDRPVLGNAGLLAEAGQGVIFAEERDDGAALAPFAHQRGRNAGQVLGDAETLVLKLSQMLGGGARLGVAHLRRSPDLVAPVDETRLDRVTATPNVTTVVHAPVRSSQVKTKRQWLPASRWPA